MDSVTQQAWESATREQRNETIRQRDAENARRAVEKQGKNAQQLRELGMCYLMGEKENRYHDLDHVYGKELLLEAYTQGDAEATLLLAQAEFYGGRSYWASSFGLSSVLKNGDVRVHPSLLYSKDKSQRYCQEAYRRGIKDCNDPRFAKFNAFYGDAIKELKVEEALLAQKAEALVEKERLAKEVEENAQKLRETEERRKREEEERNAVEAQGTTEVALSTRDGYYAATIYDPAERECAEVEFEADDTSEGQDTVHPLFAVTNVQSDDLSPAYITRSALMSQPYLSHDQLTPEAIVEQEKIAKLSPVEWDESQLVKLGWTPQVFADAKRKLDDVELGTLFSRSVRKICNYGIAATSIKGILSLDGMLETNWQGILDAHIHSVIFKKDVTDLSVTEVVQAFNNLNAKSSLELRDLIKTQLYDVLDQFGKSLDGSDLPVSEWTKEQVKKWSCGIKAISTRVGRENKIVPILAVVMRAVELANKKGYIPRATQIISALGSLNTVDKKGRLLQIATGEGKSITTAIIASVRALWGDKVDIASSLKY